MKIITESEVATRRVKFRNTEEIKLEAAFCNNLSVGVLIGGFVLPVVLLMRSLPEMLIEIISGRMPTALQMIDCLFFGGSIVLAVLVAKDQRRDAIITIRCLPDDSSLYRPSSEQVPTHDEGLG